MPVDALVRLAVALVFGWLLGSVLPADLFARRRGLDIRATGDGNPGTVNAIRSLGWGPGLATAAYDTSVGIVAVRIALALGVAEAPAYLAGLAAVAGHRFPVFRRFRGGGQGMGASAGLLVYGIAVAVSKGWLSLVDLGALLAVVVATFALTRSDAAASVVMLPCLVARCLFTAMDWATLAFLTAVAAHIWGVQLLAARRLFATRAAEASRDEGRG